MILYGGHSVQTVLSEDLRCSGGTVSNDFPVGCWNFSASHSLKTTKPTCIFCILKHDIHCNPSSPVAAIWPQNVWSGTTEYLAHSTHQWRWIAHGHWCVWCIPSVYPPLPERGDQEAVRDPDRSNSCRRYQQFYACNFHVGPRAWS